MRAQQERFVTNYKPTEESSEPVKGDETEAKRPKESGAGSDESFEDVQVTHCALCRDATSTSPLCFMVLIQVNKLLTCVSYSHLGMPRGPLNQLRDWHMFWRVHPACGPFVISTFFLFSVHHPRHFQIVRQQSGSRKLFRHFSEAFEPQFFPSTVLSS